MKFENLASVPAAIRAFYKEEVVSEATGEMVSESYTYQDESGDKQTGSRLVPEYVDVTYVTQIPFGETKGWDAVDRVISLGKPQAVVDKFVACAVAGEQQAFHDEYLAWLEECALVDAENAALLELDSESEEEGGDVDLKDYSPEPVYTATDTSVYLAKVAKKSRDAGRYDPITVGGQTFDADLAAYENLQGVVDSWESMIADEGLIEAGIVVGQTMYWTLADNSNVLVTKETLQAVITAIRVRAGLLHAQYQAAKGTLTEEA
ncbi:DUF4376 domain-containing protein [Vibrio fluvialis]|nr:DUF4376 domain-containing protein [Vibrio fluvialis]